MATQNTKIYVNLVGRVGKDLELRYMPDGVAVVNISVAVQNWTDSTSWAKVSAFGKLAERMAELIRKGSLVNVVGALVVDKETGEPSTWTDKKNITHVEIAVKADYINPLADFGKEKGDETSKSQSSKTAPPTQKPKVDVDWDNTDDIPF